VIITPVLLTHLPACGAVILHQGLQAALLLVLLLLLLVPGRQCASSCDLGRQLAC
jgi:hypothetical protein